MVSCRVVFLAGICWTKVSPCYSPALGHGGGGHGGGGGGHGYK